MVGWKHATLASMLPELGRLHAAGVVNVKVLHVVRDGRDMALKKSRFGKEVSFVGSFQKSNKRIQCEFYTVR
jgi:hypothetical protein